MPDCWNAALGAFTNEPGKFPPTPWETQPLNPVQYRPFTSQFSLPAPTHKKTNGGGSSSNGGASGGFSGGGSSGGTSGTNPPPTSTNPPPTSNPPPTT